MKLHLFSTLIISSVIIYSCSDNRTKREPETIQNQTPEVLDDSKTDVSSISKRYSSDIVQDLFNEAVSKDENLSKLTDRIHGISDIKADSLKPYKEYFQNNNAYWSSANRYISMISDSILKNDLKEIFKNLESKYKTSISKHNYLIDQIDEKQRILNDYEILMKLSITVPMISSYQKNELPDLKTLNNLINIYDTLINETKDHSKNLK